MSSCTIWPVVLIRYVEQLVASAEAAVEEVVKRGVRLLIPLCMAAHVMIPNIKFWLEFFWWCPYSGGSSKKNCCWRTFLWCIHDCKPPSTCPSSFLLRNCSFWSLQQNTYTFWFSGNNIWKFPQSILISFCSFRSLSIWLYSHMLVQNEDRTLWEATSTYVEMSPFMSANKIKKPILIIHGEEDNNPGTLTMQVE